MIEVEDQRKLKEFLNKWLSDKIENELESLFKLKNLNNSNPQIRALAFQLYENNGVVKRDEVSKIVKSLSQDERKILRDIGVKFGRYHIFLFKLFKPQSVSLRILLWKNYNQKFYELKPPTFGLNFIEVVVNDLESVKLIEGFWGI